MLILIPQLPFQGKLADPYIPASLASAVAAARAYTCCHWAAVYSAPVVAQRESVMRMTLMLS